MTFIKRPSEIRTCTIHNSSLQNGTAIVTVHSNDIKNQSNGLHESSINLVVERHLRHWLLRDIFTEIFEQQVT